MRRWLPVFLTVLVFSFMTTIFPVYAAGPSAELIAAAKKEGGVTLLHSLSRKYNKHMVKAFEKKYGIKVKWTRKGTGGIIRMVAAERMAGALKCDIVSTGDPTAFFRWIKEGVLMKYVTTNTPYFKKEIMTDPDGYFTPSRTTFATISYSTLRVKKHEIPTSWMDVLHPRWKGRIAVVDPRRSGPSRWWLGAMVQKYGWDYFKKLAKNKPLVLKQSSSAATALLNGEVDLLVVSNENNLLQRKLKGEPVTPTYPKEGMVGKTSPMGICTNPPHPNAAKLWIEFESSQEGQILHTKLAGFVGTRKDVKPYIPRPPGAFKNVLSPDPIWFMKNKKELMKNFSLIMSGK